MATPKENYAQQFRAYAQPAATPVVIPADLPASVRTYSVFDPNSNTWRRMTNDGRSPIPTQRQVVVPVQAMTPAQEQAAVAEALMQAQQNQGKIYNPLPRTPAQSPSRGSRKASQPLLKAGAVPMQGQPSKASQKAPEAPVAVQTVPAENPATTVVIPEIPGDTTVNSPAELYQGVGIAPDGTVVRQTPLATITRQGLSVPEIPTMGEVVKTNIPYAAPVDSMFTPEFDARAYDYSQGTLEGNIKRTRNTFNNFLSLLPLGSKKLNTTYSNNSMADLAKNYYNHKLHPSIYPNWNNARNPEQVGNWGGARQAARNYSQKMSENIAVEPTQRVIINPNVNGQVIVQKPGGMTVWDRYVDSKNYSEGFLNPYMKYNYGSKLNIPFLPFTR